MDAVNKRPHAFIHRDSTRRACRSGGASQLGPRLSPRRRRSQFEHPQCRCRRRLQSSRSWPLLLAQKCSYIIKYSGSTYAVVYPGWNSTNRSRVVLDMTILHAVSVVYSTLNASRITDMFLVQLHNSLIVSLLDPSAHLAPPTPPPDAPAPPPRKRRRTLPYQGEEDDTYTLRSDRKSTRLNSSHSGESRMPSSA